MAQTFKFNNGQSYQIPDVGEVFTDTQGITYKRTGDKQIQTLSREALQASGGQPKLSGLSSYNMGDVLQGTGASSIESNDLNLFQNYKAPTPTNAVIDRTFAAQGVSVPLPNPNAPMGTKAPLAQAPTNPLASSGGIMNSGTGIPNTPTSTLPTVEQLLAQYKSGGNLTTGQITGTTPIGDPVKAPATSTTGTTTPSFQPPQAPSVMDTYTQSLIATLASQKTAMDAETTKRANDYQAKIDAITKQQSEIQTLQESGILNEGSTVAKETAEKRAALDLEKQRVDENYNANQTLINELDGLLTKGNQVIEQMKGTTGLASIMNPRISQTMTDVAARAGVIQAVLSARNGQIGVAQNQLASSLSAISSIYKDQIDYYDTLQNFYKNTKDENGKLLVTLTNDQKDYLDQKLISLKNDVAQTQATAQIIEKAMLDPDTAQAYAQAGVSLTDSPAQINQKLATYAYAKEIKDTSNAMAKEGYSVTPIAGGIPITTTDSKGVQKTWYKAPSANSVGGVLSILDVQRYNDAFPNAGVTAGDSEATANAKVAKVSTPEGALTSQIQSFKLAGTSYDKVVSDINSSATITDKALALKVAKTVYGAEDTKPNAPIKSTSSGLIITGEKPVAKTTPSSPVFTGLDLSPEAVKKFQDSVQSFLFK